MLRPMYAGLLGPEFDDFLFAPLGEERHGMRPSVLSSLTLLDLDPWAEAAALAELPGAAATQRLAALIALLPNAPATERGSDTIAARLVALLPRRAAPNRTLPNASPLKSMLSGGNMAHSQTILFVALMILALGVEWIVASDRLSGQAPKTPAPISRTSVPLSAAVGRR